MYPYISSPLLSIHYISTHTPFAIFCPQYGNYVARTTHDCSKTLRARDKIVNQARTLGCSDKLVQYINLYFNEMEEILKELMPKMVPEEQKQCVEACMTKILQEMSLSKLVCSQVSTMSNHTDKKCILPFGATRTNPRPFREWDGGEFLFTYGGFVVDYKDGDVILCCGDFFHAVLPLLPKPNVKQACRQSVVHFSEFDLEAAMAERAHMEAMGVIPPPPLPSKRKLGDYMGPKTTWDQNCVGPNNCKGRRTSSS